MLLITHLHLGGFDTYFHIFAVMNLAYATIKQFQQTIDEKLSLLAEGLMKSTIDGECEELKEKLTVSLSEKTAKKAQKKVEAIRDSVHTQLDDLITDSKTIFNDYGLKSMFLSSFLFCMSYVIIGGYEQFFKSE